MYCSYLPTYLWCGATLPSGLLTCKIMFASTKLSRAWAILPRGTFYSGACGRWSLPSSWRVEWKPETPIGKFALALDECIHQATRLFNKSVRVVCGVRLKPVIWKAFMDACSISFLNTDIVKRNKSTMNVTKLKYDMYVPTGYSLTTKKQILFQWNWIIPSCAWSQVQILSLHVTLTFYFHKRLRWN